MSRYEYQIDFGEFSGWVIRQYDDLEAAIWSALGIENNLHTLSLSITSQNQRGPHERACEVTIVLNNAVKMEAYVVIRELPGAAIAQDQAQRLAE